jgi:hypothetical protein
MNHIGDVAQIITGIGLMLTGCSSAFNCWISWRNGKKADAIVSNVQVIEKATNSMKDALVAATAKASLAEGHAEGLQQGRAEERK